MPHTMSSSGNVDAAEIAKFSALASQWWDPNGNFHTLHAINPLRLNWIESVAEGLAHKKVVDVGCGGGILAESMAGRQAQVVGLDMAEKSLKIARLHSLESGIPVEYLLQTVESYADAHPASQDVVTCMEMLEHVPDYTAVIRACAQLVRPKGFVFFSTINRTPKAFLQAIVGAEYVLQMLPRGTHEYARFIRPSELCQAARTAGLELVATKGLGYRWMRRQFYLHDDVSVNYLLGFQRL